MRRCISLAVSVCCAGLCIASSAAEETEDGETLDDLGNIADESETVIVIEAPAKSPVLGPVEIDAEDGEQIAGSQGDAIKALATVGGVARVAGNAKGLSILGTTPAETRIYVDGVPIPRLFHFGGTRSLLPTSELSSIRMTLGGAPARFGRGLGGAIEVQTAELSWQDAEMQFRADPLDVGGSFESPVGERGALSVAGRSSVLSPIFAALAPGDAEKVFAIPDYWDYLARLSYQLEDGQEVRVLALLSGDELQRQIPGRMQSSQFTEESSAGFGRLAVALNDARSKGTRQLLLWVGRETETTDYDYGNVDARQNAKTTSAGLLLQKRERLGSNLSLRLGVDAEAFRSKQSRSGALTLPAREGDIQIFGQAPGNRVNADDWTVTGASVALFATASLRLGKQLTLEPGLRLEPSFINGNRVLPARPSEPEVGYTELSGTPDPRARVTYVGPHGFKAYGSGGRYSQAAAPADLSPVFGSPVLKPSRAWQLLVGTEVAPATWLSFGARSFVASQRDLAVRAPDATPAVANLLESTGRGRVWGTSVSVTAEPSEELRGRLEYTFLEADRRRPGRGWRTFDLDQPHTLRTTMQWSGPRGISVGARLEVASGFPRTSVVDAVFNAGSQRYDPIYGVHNGTKLPLFVDLSLRAEYASSSETGTYRIWLDVMNASNRFNALERYYSADFRQTNFVRGLPLLPIVGAELRI